MDIKKILKLVDSDLIRVGGELKRNLQSDVGLISEVGEHLILSGGKRLRPMLLLMAADLAGYKGDRHILLAAVVEFIHTATLLHDDVVDNAELRRGKSSANSLWGNEVSVLVGDFLYSKSFLMAVECENLRILKVLSEATTDMAKGMVFELIKTHDLETSEDDYIQVIKDKTAVLISATCQVGGILGGLDEEKEHALRDYGMNMGIAFQLMDDSMDYVSNEKDFGKTIGTDLQEGKVTLPVIKALSECTDEERLTLKGLLDSDSVNKSDFDLALELINKYAGIEYTVSKAKDYVSRAKDSLDLFADSAIKDALLEMADYVIERDS
ncbi:MAG: polyprenyl synthetase family protein [bacterium]|nr:polyprenyl synthetase family protein [bacterium]